MAEENELVAGDNNNNTTGDVELEPSSNSSSEIRSQKLMVIQKLEMAIENGFPHFNKGNTKQCCTIYDNAATETIRLLETSQNESSSKDATEAKVLQVLEGSLAAAKYKLQNDPKYDEAAWILRHAFDEALATLELPKPKFERVDF